MGKKILLADDSITIQKVIELTFSDEDFDVVTVGNGRLALEKLSEVRPDIVLCDIIMPEKDGYEVCEHIRKEPRTKDVPVLVVSARLLPSHRAQAEEAGATAFMPKPYAKRELLKHLKALLPGPEQERKR